MRYHPAWERLYLAVEYMATSDLEVALRIETVFDSHLTPLRPEDFRSNKAKELFGRIKEISKVSIRSLTVDQAKAVAKDIVSLYVQVDHFGDAD